jgi:hypothetical protein
MHLHSTKCTGSHLGLNMSYRCSGNKSRQVATWHRGSGSNAQGTLPHIALHTGTAPLSTLHEKTQMSEKSIKSHQIKHTLILNYANWLCSWSTSLPFLFKQIIQKFLPLVGREGIACLMPITLQILPWINYVFYIICLKYLNISKCTHWVDASHQHGI